MTLGLDSGVSSKIQLEDLLRKKSASIKVPLVCQSESYNNLVMDVLIKGAIILIDIKPALKVTNLCPVPLVFQMKTNGFEESGEICKGKTIEVYKFDPYKDPTMLILKMNQNFSVAVDLTKLLNGNNEKVKFQLSDPNNPTQKLLLDVTNIRKHNSLTIYSKFMIINETGLSLNLLSFDSAISGSSVKLIQSQEGKIMFMPNKNHSTIVIKPNLQTFDDFQNMEKLPDNEVIRASSFFPINISYNLNQKLTGGKDKSFFEFNMAVNPSVVKLEEGIVTKTITLTPKYIFINDTQFDLNLIQTHVSKMVQVNSMTRSSVLWRTQDKMLSFQIIDSVKQL